MNRAILIQGSSRGIGLALTKHYANCPTTSHVFATCRNPVEATALNLLAASSSKIIPVQLDVTDETSVKNAYSTISSTVPNINMLLNLAGVLRDESNDIIPERRLTEFTPEASIRSFQINALGPMLMAKHFLPLLTPPRDAPDSATLVNFSARVGSIGDNKSGGWASYRASKSAANSFFHTLHFELSRKNIAVVSIHPGTVDTDLTRAFLKARAKYNVQDVDEAAASLAKMFDSFTVKDHGGKFIDQNGIEIPW
jgi:NAD(P)-dependent dehydrogenase (short-subunit alcohol dehydrogenase family)